MALSTDHVNQTSASQAKIALFRSLFRGREDVYPRRFESRKTGRSGYAPACGNEWVRGICEKLRIKCAECPNRRFLPVTDEVIRWHLSATTPMASPLSPASIPCRSVVPRRPRRRGVGWRSASGGSSRVPPRPSQGPIASGERVSGVALPCRRRGQRPGPCARLYSAIAESRLGVGSRRPPPHDRETSDVMTIAPRRQSRVAKYFQKRKSDENHDSCAATAASRCADGR
jgi:hypothetical protein